MNYSDLKYFDYPLKEDLIAQYPKKNRTDSRMLHFCQGRINHLKIKDLVNLLQPNDVVVINNSKTIKARLFAKRPTGAKVELLFENSVDEYHFEAMSRSNRLMKKGDLLLLKRQKKNKLLSTQLKVSEKKLNGRIYLQSKLPIVDLLGKYGHIPLPPYIDREDEKLDKKRYQTVYAKKGQSIAAPTAGLHFDDFLLKNIKEKGIQIIDICLDVGSGTFKPVKTENINQHQMHFENYHISKKNAKKINQAINQKKRIVAIGSTSTRALESNFQLHGKIKAGTFKTNLFIKPGFKFKLVRAMITNFHIPKSTLVMMVATFMGYENWKKAYQQAIKEKYQFLSYGDCMFIEADSHEI